jgi:hypothetical protein
MANLILDPTRPSRKRPIENADDTQQQPFWRPALSTTYQMAFEDDDEYEGGSLQTKSKTDREHDRFVRLLEQSHNAKTERVARLLKNPESPIFCAIDPCVIHRPSGRGGWLPVFAHEVVSEMGDQLIRAHTLEKKESQRTSPALQKGWTVVGTSNENGWVPSCTSGKFGALEAICETKVVNAKYGDSLSMIELELCKPSELAFSTIPNCAPPTNVKQTEARRLAHTYPGAVLSLQLRTLPIGFAILLEKPFFLDSSEWNARLHVRTDVEEESVNVGQVRLLLDETYRYRHFLEMRQDFVSMLPFATELALWRIIAEYQLLIY